MCFQGREGGVDLSGAYGRADVCVACLFAHVCVFSVCTHQRLASLLMDGIRSLQPPRSPHRHVVPRAAR